MTSTDVPPRAPTAILSALAEEQSGLVDLLEGAQQVKHAGRDFWRGTLHGHPVVLVLARIGKVAATTTAVALIERFRVGRIVFVGVAGGLGKGVNVGDVVVADSFVQHDMDASPLFPRYEVPLYGKTVFESDAALTSLLYDAAVAAGTVPAYPAARVHRGLMISGDRFVCGAQEAASICAALIASGHTPMAVEMEGAAVAQVCHDYGVAFASVRTISDRADDSAHVDFPAFVAEVASVYARAIVDKLLPALPA